MSQFEFVMVFVSILLALAVAEILAGLGRMIREREHVRIYWVHVGWMVLGICSVTQGWWAVWDVRTYEFTNFFQFFAMTLPQLGFVLVAFVLSPPIAPGQPFDLREFYFRQIGWIAGLVAASLTAIAIYRAMMGVEEILGAINAVRFSAIAAFITMSFNRNPTVHGAAVCVVFALFSVGVALTFRPA